MPTFKIRAVYEYEGEVEAKDSDAAYKAFLNDLNSHYSSTDELEITEVETCDECGEVTDECECDDSDDDGDSDTADGEWLASAGWGTDEDYE